MSLLLLACWFVLLVIVALRDLAGNRARGSMPRWGILSAAVMFITMGMLCLHVPKRVTLALCCSDLWELLDEAPVSKSRTGKELGRRIGPYWVDRYGTDSRGGTFFRTHTSPDGPDEISYGFAFRPNGQGTPFGNARYRQRWLFGDWFVFAASDDW